MADGGSKRRPDHDVPTGNLIDLPTVHASSSNTPITAMYDNSSEELDLYSAAAEKPEDNFEVFDNAEFRPPEQIFSLNVSGEDRDEYDDVRSNVKTRKNTVPIDIPKEDVAQQKDGSKIIKVKGIKRTTSNDTLLLFFENRKRSGGGEIQEVLREKSSPEARIVFKDSTDAGNVLKRGPLALEGSKLTLTLEDVSESAEPKRNTVLVKGLSRETTTETIECFFENKKRTGGGEIELINHCTTEGEAKIIFVNPEDAARVIERKNIKMGDSTLSVTWWTEEKENTAEAEDVGSSKEDLTIIVTGMAGKISEVTLQCLFENKRRTGGGTITDYKKLDENTAKLVFEKVECANTVLERRNFSLEGTELTAQRMADFTPIKVESPSKDTILVKGIQDSLSVGVLTLFLENRRRSGGGPVSGMKFNPDKQTALVTFENPEDANNVVQKGEFVFDEHSFVATWPDIAGSPTVDDTAAELAVSRSLMIRGLNPKTSPDVIKLFFENPKRSGGGKIDYIQHDADRGTAFITFITADSAKSVLQRNNLTLEGFQLNVEIADIKPKISKTSVTEENTVPITSIEVSGFAGSSNAVTAELLQLFFENKRTSGGGEIKSINLDKENGVAAVTFMNAKDAKEVLRRGTENPFKAFGVTLKVKGLETEVPAVSCAIEVKGFAADMNEDLLVLFFENRRRSGGDTIEAIHYDVENRRAVITYTNIEVPQRVLQKQPVELDGCTLNIKMLQPARPAAPVHGPADKEKILVRYIPEGTPTEDLKLFLQGRSDCKVREVKFGLTEGHALVEFDGIPDYDAVRELVSMKPLCGQMLGVEQVPFPNSIQVHNICGVKRDLLTLYFENERRSGGGSIEDITFFDEGDYATIKFSDRKVLRRLLARKHILNATDLEVSMFYECLGILPPGHDPSQPPTRLPSFLDITDTDPNVLTFIMSSQRKEVEQELAKVYCQIQWPNKNKQPLHFVCTIKRCDTNWSKKAKEWVKTVENVWYNDLVKRYTKTTVDTLQHTWKEFLKRVGDTRQYEEDKVKVQMHDSSCSVEIWGITDAVFKVAHHLTNIQRTLEEELDRAKKSVTEQVTLKPHQLLMLRAIHFDQKEKEVFPGIDIKISNKEIVFTGLPNVITSAKLKMYEIVNSIVSENFPDVPESVCRLLKKKPIRDHLVNHFKGNNMRMTWDAGKKNLIVYAMTDSDLKKGVSVIMSEVIEAKINMEVNSTVLHTEKWKLLRDTLLSRYPETLEIKVSEDDGQIYVAAINNQCNLVIEDIKNFIAENVILEKTIVLDSVKYKFISKSLCDEIGKIVSDLKNMLVGIQFKVEDDEHFMVIKANRFGLSPAEKRVQDMLGGIVSRDHDISKPGMGKYFVTKRGQGSIEAAESRHKVAIELVTDEKEKKHSAAAAGRTLGSPIDTKDKTVSKTRLKNGTEVFVCKGDLTDYKVGAIVNAANEDLAHVGGLAYAIAQKGGKSVQEECYAYIRKSGKLLPGQVYTSSPGKLQCKKIHHAVGPKWQGGRRNEENLLYDAIYECLSATINCKLDSVALPALSAGVYGVPLQISTKNIVSAVNDFCEKESEATRLKKIYLVDNQQKTVDQFHKSLTDRFGESLVVLVDATSPRKVGNPSVMKGPAAAPPVSGKQLYIKVDDKTLVTLKGVKVTLCKGGIEAQQVDVIVNTTSQNIDANSGVSGAIFKAAGPNLKAETRQFVPLNPGTIAVTSGQNLQCQNIYHVSCSGWDGPNGKCERFIKQIIADSLKTAAQSGYTSIAFPAIGTGNNKVPHDKCAELLYHEVATNSNNTIKDVRFVIYDKDTESIKAFEAEVRRQACPPKAGNSRHRSLVDHSSSVTEGSDNLAHDYTFIEPDSSGRGTESYSSSLRVNLGPVELQLELGDITKESTDAIVNSTNEKIDLSTGEVARALAKAGGPQFVEECKKAVVNDNIAITRGWKLKAHNVIHIAAPSGAKSWKKAIKKSLEEADKRRYRSVAFPALGTGQLQVSGSIMASVMLDTIAEFAEDKPVSLHLVRIIIYSGQSHILDTFRTEILKKAAHGKKKTWWSSFKDVMTGIYNSLTDSGPITQSFGDKKSFSSVKVFPLAAKVTKLRVCANSPNEIDAVIKEIEELCDDECKDKVMDSTTDQENIDKLSEVQIARIQSLDETCAVKITIEVRTRVKRIRLQGTSEDVSKVVEQIYAIFMENNKKEHERSRAELVKKQVQWYFEDGGDLDEYPDDINSKIEEAYDLKKPEVEWTEADGRKFKIDFGTMSEFEIGSAGAKVKVHRKAKGGGGVELPPNWTPADPNKPFQLIALSATDSEYKDVEGKFRASAGGHINNIVSIERVQNTSMFQKYAVHKDSMMKENPSGNLENTLWHGTSVDTLESIHRYGFNRSYCGKNATALGNGVYFAQNASYSCSSSYARPDPATGQKHIYMCKVLTGHYAHGGSGMRVPPVKSGTILYDSVVDNINSPTIFVIFSDTQAYPEYHITFA